MSETKRLNEIIKNLNFSKTLRLIWSLTPALTALTLFLIFVENIFFLLSAFAFKQLINAISHISIHGTDKDGAIRHYFIFNFITALLFMLTKSFSAYISELQGARVNEHIDDKIHGCAVELDLAFYESPDYFDTLKRAKDAGADRPVGIVTTFLGVIKNAAMLLTLSYIITVINWGLIPLLILFLIPAFIVRLRLAKQLHARRLVQTPFERQASYISSLIVGDTLAKEIRGFGLGNYLKTKYLKIRLGLLEERMQIVKRGAINSAITDSIATIAFFSCIGYVCYNAFLGKISVGEITLFLVMFPQLFNILQNISSGVSKLYQDNIFLTHLFKLFDLRSNLIETNNPVSVPVSDGMTLEVKNMSFTYPHSTSPALTNINLIIPAGKLTAIVGLNGAGKTTLIKMLCRLYDPTAGSIQLGEIDIRNFDSANYRKCVSTVFQDFGKYNVSAADNIRFGNIDDTCNVGEISKAAEASGANAYIDKFPDKYETIMGRLFENGREISIGQWQKLAIARAIYSPSKFIILDEATSALDAKSEKELFETLRDNIGNRGALIISHRLSAVQHADYIYVMTDGQVTQAGTHQQLIEMDGDYANLFKKTKKQFAQSNNYEN
ncbi:ABC transporter ATP-binding protein [Mucilaginibacter sp. L196]|uniref:ABC transporter ATP-binding protein n=1 Tax=Mucilaginibacter sp. L196 TaxID=1641870 RepID=UPI00131AAE88|nr:ABC transporter ATP-binding protein [Mucilaginibacter sp. L196]